MARIDGLKKKIDGYLRKEQLLKNQEHIRLEKPFLAKARKNFTIASLLFKISEQEELKKALALASDFNSYDWVFLNKGFISTMCLLLQAKQNHKLVIGI